jgi:hypothetical protein
MNRRFALALLALFAIASPLYAAEEATAPAAPAADNTTKIDAARAALTAWLKLADAGDYTGMWNAGAATFKSAVTEATWTQMGTSAHTQLGAMQTRTETSASYSTTLPAMPTAPAGDYVVIQFTSSFAAAKVTETLVATLEADGTWRGMAYAVRPAQ